MSADNPTTREYAALAFALALARGELTAILQGERDKTRIADLLKATSSKNIASAVQLKEADLAVDWTEYLSDGEMNRIALRDDPPRGR